MTRAAAGLSGTLLIAGLGISLAGCPSQNTETASTPPPVAHAAGFHGVVFGGRQPIVGATVVAYAAGATVGAVATELGTDTTDSSGRFDFTFAPTPATGQSVYVTVAGGDAGGGTNAAIGLMTVAGAYCDPGSGGCTFPNHVNINELTTVASAAALKDYVTFVDCTTIAGNTRSGTCLALRGATGLARIAETIKALVNAATGEVSTFLAAQPATSSNPVYVSLQKLDALASIIAACVNASAGDDACTELFAAALGRPTDTLAAAWEVAAWPGVNAKGSALFSLLPPGPIYSTNPPLTAAPDNWTIAGGRFAYVSDQNSGMIFAWRLSPLTGIMASVTGGGAGACSTPAWPVSPDPMNCFAAGNAPSALALDPLGRYVWVIDRSNSEIATYAIDPATGALVATGTLAVDADGPVALAADPAGDFVYVADEGGNGVSAWEIGADGALTKVDSAPAGTAPVAIAVSPVGAYLYVANRIGGTISAYVAGTLTAVDTASAGSRPAALAVDPTGRYLYVANKNGDDISAFEIGAGGMLTPVSGSPFAAGDGPASVAVDATGHYLYVTNEAGGDVSAFAIGAGGVLAPISGSPYITGGGPVALAADATGRYLYVVNGDDNSVSAWWIAQTTTPSGTAAGALTPISYTAAYPAGTYTDAIAVDPSGRYVYAVNSNCHDPQKLCPGTAGSVSAWRLDAASGALVPIAAAPFAAGESAELIALDPFGRSVYVANRGDTSGNSSVFAWSVDSATGALTALGTYPLAVGTGPYSITVAPDGDHVYTANFDSNGISAFSRNADGTLTFLQTAPASGTGPLSVAIAPDGQYLYTANHTSGDISGYALNSITGLPSEITGSPFPASASTDWIAMDPVAPYAYAVNFDADNVTGYEIGADGALTPVSGSPFAAGTGKRPRGIAVDPFGRYVYTGNHTGDDVSAWRILADGSLQVIVGSPFAAGDEPLAIAVDPSGHYVYTANHSGNDVSAFVILSTGALAPVAASSPFAAGAGPTAIATSP